MAKKASSEGSLLQVRHQKKKAAIVGEAKERIPERAEWELFTKSHFDGTFDQLVQFIPQRYKRACFMPHVIATESHVIRLAFTPIVPPNFSSFAILLEKCCQGDGQ